MWDFSVAITKGGGKAVFVSVTDSDSGMYRGFCLCVQDLVDQCNWSVLWADSSCGHRTLRPAQFTALRTVLGHLARAWASRLPVQGTCEGLDVSAGLHFTPSLSQRPVCSELTVGKSQRPGVHFIACLYPLRTLILFTWPYGRKFQSGSVCSFSVGARHVSL